MIYKLEVFTYEGSKGQWLTRFRCFSRASFPLVLNTYKIAVKQYLQALGSGPLKQF